MFPHTNVERLATMAVIIVGDVLFAVSFGMLSAQVAQAEAV